MRQTIVAMLVAALSFLSACKSDVTNVNVTNATTALRLKPDTVRGITYQPITISARVDGLAATDVRYRWNFGDGHADTALGATVSYSYRAPGTYTITATARDAFADTLIGTSNAVAIIGESDHGITILPRSGDSTVPLDEQGRFPSLLVNYQVQYRGDNQDQLTRYSVTISRSRGDSNYALPPSSIVQITVNEPETITIVAEARNSDGTIFGRDTSVRRYIGKPFDLSVLRTMNYLSVHLALNTATFPSFQSQTHSLKTGLKITDPSSWNGTTLSLAQSGVGTGSGVNTTASFDERLVLQCNADGSQITGTTASVNDSIRLSGSTAFLHWSYNLVSMKLYRVTPTSVIYMVADTSVAAIATSLEYSSTANPYTGPESGLGCLSSYSFPAPFGRAPFAYVMFTRQ